MIVYDLQCHAGQHRFEGWFKSSDDYARQQERGLVSCPHCGSVEVVKALQAPRLARKGNQLPDGTKRPRPVSEAPQALVPAPQPQPAASPPPAPVANAPLPPQAVEMIQALAKMQAEALKTSRYVGEKFVEDARAMHYGEKDEAPIHGRATLEQAQELAEEGIPVMPLPFPVTPPEEAN